MGDREFKIARMKIITNFGIAMCSIICGCLTFYFTVYFTVVDSLTVVSKSSSAAEVTILKELVDRSKETIVGTPPWWWWKRLP
jgi:hypothetical protein